MRIVFMGTPDFAASSLERLYADGHDIAAVFTQPDKPSGRGMKVKSCPVKELALRHGTVVYQPHSLRDAETAGIIRDLRSDVIAVVAYGKLLPQDILEIPPLGCVNIHASLLPKYRGAAPIEWAVMRGEKETGVTSMYMSAELDAGDMILVKKTAVGENETAGELRERLSILGAELLGETLEAIARGDAPRVRQSEDCVSYAPTLNREMARIDWTETASVIRCKIRGLNPLPAAAAEFGGTVFKIFAAEIGECACGDVAPGTVISEGKRGLEVACADAPLIITELQAPGGRRMAAAEYLRGRRICR